MTDGATPPEFDPYHLDAYHEAVTDAEAWAGITFVAEVVFVLAIFIAVFVPSLTFGIIACGLVFAITLCRHRTNRHQDRADLIYEDATTFNVNRLLPPPEEPP